VDRTVVARRVADDDAPGDARPVGSINGGDRLRSSPRHPPLSVVSVTRHPARPRVGGRGERQSARRTLVRRGF
jgi:hypothetical protein